MNTYETMEITVIVNVVTNILRDKQSRSDSRVCNGFQSFFRGTIQILSGASFHPFELAQLKLPRNDSFSGKTSLSRPAAKSELRVFKRSSEVLDSSTCYEGCLFIALAGSER